MAKGNIRLYNTKAEYLAEKDGFELPNVSFIEDIKNCFYHSFIKNAYLKLKYNVTSTEQTTPIIAENQLNALEEIVIDGNSMSPVKEYTFATTGEHDVWFKFTDEAINYNGAGNVYVAGFSTNQNIIEITEIPTDLLQLTNAIFAGCNNIIKANFYTPNSRLNFIGNSAFASCVKLNNVVIPDTVLEISTGAFSSCIGLKEIVLSKSLQKIRSGAFGGCSGLTEVIMPNTVSEIDFSSFSGCSNIERLVLSSSLRELSSGNWNNNKNLKEVIIPEGLETIYGGTFNNCTGLTEIVLPSTITNVENSAFYGCTGIERLVLSPSMKTIKSNNWNYNPNLKEVVIPEGIESIDSMAFAECTGLTEIVLPSTITSLSDNVFDSCASLTKIVSLNTVAPTLEHWNAFDNIAKNGVLYVPYGCTEAYSQWMNTESDYYLGAQGWTIQELPQE